MCPMDVDDTEAGRRVGLTLVERVKYGTRTMDACDVTAAEAKAFYDARKREQNWEATRRWRLRQSENVVGMSKADLQRKKIYSILRSTSKADPQQWSTVSDLTKAVARSRVFAGLKDRSLRSRIHEALDRLAETSAIDRHRHRPIHARHQAGQIKHPPPKSSAFRSAYALAVSYILECTIHFSVRRPEGG